MGTIYQRRPGGTYYGYWTDTKNRHHRKTLRTKDPRVARERLRQLELVSTDRAAYSKTSLDEAVSALLDTVEAGNANGTYRSYKQKARHLRRIFGDMELSNLTKDDGLAYVRQRRHEKAGDSTIHKELVVLRRALQEAKSREIWSGEPRAIVPVIKVVYHPRERWLTPQQFAALLEALPEHRRLWAALAALAGGSLSEVERTVVEHVDLTNKRIRIPGKKRSTRFRLVPIHPSLAPMLRASTRGRSPSEPLVEPWPNVRRDLHAAVDRVNADPRTKKIGSLPRVSPNDLRRTFASWLKQEGIDSLTVAHLMGHSSTRMVELVYGRLSNETYQDAVAAMPRLRKLSNR